MACICFLFFAHEQLSPFKIESLFLLLWFHRQLIVKHDNNVVYEDFYYTPLSPMIMVAAHVIFFNPYICKALRSHGYNEIVI